MQRENRVEKALNTCEHFLLWGCVLLLCALTILWEGLTYLPKKVHEVAFRQAAHTPLLFGVCVTVLTLWIAITLRNGIFSHHKDPVSFFSLWGWAVFAVIYPCAARDAYNRQKNEEDTCSNKLH